MLKSLYAGVSGMKGFQGKLDVIGNNIANVNTVGFKKGRVMFQDLLSQNLSGVTAPNPADDGRGGVNPNQIGLGVQMGSIDTLHTPGSPMTTGVITDLLIEGDGFFLVAPNQNGVEDPFYTRAGNFSLDAARQLNLGGMLVLGQDVLEIDDVTGNAEVGQFANPGGEATIRIPESVTYETDPGDPLTETTSDVNAFNISSNGDIIVGLDDGSTHVIGAIAIGTVENPGGLRKAGGSLYQMTTNANPDGHNIQTVDDAARTSAIISGQLEMSNVDMTEEFTEMIVAQRGFQANSRIITTSDEILQEVVNLKR